MTLKRFGRSGRDGADSENGRGGKPATRVRRIRGGPETLDRRDPLFDDEMDGPEQDAASRAAADDATLWREAQAHSQSQSENQREASGRRATPSMGRYLRFLLPLAALGLVAAVFLQSKGSRGPLPLIDTIKLGAGIQVVNPRYNGSTSDGAPFSIRAAVARPDGPDPTEITLEEVVGSFGMKDGRAIDAHADTGVYFRQENRVKFNGDVTVASSDGYSMRSNSAEVDLDAMTIEAHEPVAADGPVGELEAGSMRAIQDGGGVVWFENGVRMTIRRLVESRATGE